MAIKELSDSNPDGTRLGQATTDLIGFYGATCLAQPTGATSVTTTAAVQGATAAWGFATTAQFNAVLTALNTIITNLGTTKLNLMG